MFVLLQRTLFIITKSLEHELFCYVSNLLNLVKLFHINSIISTGPYEFRCQSILCCQPLFLISLKFFSRSTVFKNNLIELTASHMIWSFWLSSDKINSTLCKICQTCHWEVTTKKNKNKKKKKKKS